MAGAYEAARAPSSTFLSAITLAGQTTITARPDGSLLVSPDPATGRPGAYHEVRPWVWQEIGGQRILTTRTDGDRVTAVGFGAAFTLLPVPPWRDASLVLPLVTAALLVLLGAVLSRPVGAAIRRRHGLAAPVPASRIERLASTGTAFGAGAAVVALVGWCGAVLAIGGLADVPSGVLVVLIGLQAVGVLGLVPATAGVLTAVRHRAGAGRIVGRLAVTLSLAAVALPAWGYGLLTPDLSY